MPPKRWEGEDPERRARRRAALGGLRRPELGAADSDEDEEVLCAIAPYTAAQIDAFSPAGQEAARAHNAIYRHRNRAINGLELELGLTHQIPARPSDTVRAARYYCDHAVLAVSEQLLYETFVVNPRAPAHLRTSEPTVEVSPGSLTYSQALTQLDLIEERRAAAAEALRLEQSFQQRRLKEQQRKANKRKSGELESAGVSHKKGAARQRKRDSCAPAKAAKKKKEDDEDDEKDAAAAAQRARIVQAGPIARLLRV